MRADSILQTIGNTPHVRINRLFGPQANVWIKSERSNPGGSIKDRIALAMVEAAEKLKNTSKFVAKPLYQINDSEMALSDSDWLYDFLKLLIDRVGSNSVKMETVRKFVYEMDSELKSLNKT